MNAVEPPDEAYDPTDSPAPAQAVYAYGAGDAALIPHADEHAPEQPLPTTPGRATGSLVAIAAGAMLLVTNEIAPMGLITLIADDLGRSESAIGLLTTAFAITVTLASIPVARVTTKWSRKPAVLTALGVWIAGTLVVALSEGFAQLLVGRGLTGIAHALFWAVAAPAVAGMFPPAVRGRSVARMLIGASGAGVIGMPAATWLGQVTSWRTPFLVLAICGVLIFVAVAIIMPSFRTVEGTAARGEFPDRRRFIRVVLVTFLTVTSVATTFTYITPILVRVAGFSAGTVPVLLAIGGAVGVLAMWLTSRSLDRFPVRAVAFGLVMLLGAWIVLALWGSSGIVAVTVLVLHGFSWAVLVAAMINWAIRHSPWATDLGVATYNTTFNAGNTVGSVGGGVLLTWLGAAYLPAASAVLVAVALVLVWQIRPMRGLAGLRRSPQAVEPR